ncbi:alpha/beta fold hydrolase [Kineococcus arenarius]|uniref:alpha/beta fold hydrolase n=1 Tax=unclassified Kineococcus TaxID=2621656 RepID=UPI003D7CF774
MHVILVHGAGGSSATWSSVAALLDARGIPHTVADNPSQSLTEDTGRVTGLVQAAGEDVVLVGHSYGGAVITNAGRSPGVRGLVYVAAWVPDEGESVQSIVRRYPPAEVSAHFTRGPAGEWIPVIDEASRLALAWDVPEDIWAAAPERVSGDRVFSEVIGTPAWSALPSWYVLATSDKHIRVEAQRDMAMRAGASVVEVDTSHAVPHAAPDRLVEVIEAAVASLAAGDAVPPAIQHEPSDNPALAVVQDGAHYS